MTRSAGGWDIDGHHGCRIHNVVGTREQVLGHAEILDPDDAPVPGRADATGE